MPLGDVYVGITVKLSYNSKIWTYLYDAYVFFQFRVLIRILELISAQNLSRYSFILYRLDTLSLRVYMLGSLKSSVIIH